MRMIRIQDHSLSREPTATFFLICECGRHLWQELDPAFDEQPSLQARRFSNLLPSPSVPNPT